MKTPIDKIFIETTQEEYDKRFKEKNNEVDDTSKDKSESKNKGENING